MSIPVEMAFSALPLESLAAEMDLQNQIVKDACANLARQIEAEYQRAIRAGHVAGRHRRGVKPDPACCRDRGG